MSIEAQAHEIVAHREATRRIKGGDVRKTRTFREYIDVATRGLYRWHRHSEDIATALQAVESGECNRLIVITPPRHGKSMAVSELFPGYVHERQSRQHVGLTGYGSSLTLGFSRRARGYFTEAGNTLGEKQTDEEWTTQNGGMTWASGLTGSLTGKGFHVGVIDDPIKSRKEADSPTYRKRVAEAYFADFHTRRQTPAAAEIITLTRWHSDDLVGRLMAQEEIAPEGWWILHLPGIRDGVETEYPASCRVLDDWRNVGEALCEDWWPLRELERLRDQNPAEFEALYQGRPPRKTGDFFPVDMIATVEAHEIPAGLDEVRSWDLAASKGSGDWTVGLKVGRDSGSGRYFVTDMVRKQADSLEVRHMVRGAAERDGVGCLVRMPQDPGQAGKAQAADFARLLGGYRFKILPVTGAKDVRAGPVASQVRAGTVAVLRAPWNAAFFHELSTFDGTGGTDDVVDALSDAYDELNAAQMTPFTFSL